MFLRSHVIRSSKVPKVTVTVVSLKTEECLFIKTIFDRHDVFVSLPTGYGKRLYQQALLFHMVFKLDPVNTEEESC